MAARWHYSGDLNPEHGGFWYRLDNMHYNYAEAFRITPCSDAGGPDNQYWVESLTVNIPDDREKLNQALVCCGAIDEYDSATPRQRQHMAVQCCVVYGFYDTNQTETVQVGAKLDPFYSNRGRTDDPVIPDTVLRGGSDIGRYVRRVHLSGNGF